ncbi:MAG: LysM peptidoglycan-binding domain-containing protein [Kiritimatiellae bacterium]|nr:LysM peptidoglycan-binding domain-containing protein [Kiritimatiellia bacterium]
MKKCICITILSVVLAGCVTTSGRRRNADLRKYNEIEILKRKVSQLENSLAEVSAGRERLYDEMGSLRSSVKKDNDSTKNHLAALDRLVKTAENARVRDREQIVAALTEKMLILMKKDGSAAQVYERGRIHIVEAGQTLSVIARAYAVTVKAIVAANKDISTKNSIIKVGQKVFIPE